MTKQFPILKPATYDERIADLERQLVDSKNKSDALRIQIGKLHQQQHKLRLQLAELKFGVTVGCIVVGRDNKQFKVARVDTRWDRPWIEGHPMNKDGKWSTTIRNLFDDWRILVNSSNP